MEEQTNKGKPRVPVFFRHQYKENFFICPRCDREFSEFSADHQKDKRGIGVLQCPHCGTWGE